MRAAAIGRLGLAVVFGCAVEGVPGADRSDSGRAPAGEPAGVASEPVLVVGAADGDAAQVLYRVRNPFLLPNGELVIPVAGDHQVRVFGADGALRRTLGRQGQGPGEFMDLTEAWARGDTVEVFDFRLQRITRFPPAGEPEVAQLQNFPFGSSVVEGALSGGWLARILVNTDPATRILPGRDSLVLTFWRRDGTRGSEIASVAGLARHADADGQVTPDPLSPDARVVIALNRIYVGDTAQPIIRVVDETAAPMGEVAWTVESRRSAREVLTEVRDTLLARTPAERVAAVRRRFESAPAAAAVSVFWGLLVDDLGFLWIRSYEPLIHAHVLGGWAGPGPGGEWMIFSPDGARVAIVRLPPDLRPTHIARDHIVGIRRDGDGVETVGVYRIDRSQDGA